MIAFALALRSGSSPERKARAGPQSLALRSGSSPKRKARASVKAAFNRVSATVASGLFLIER